MSQHDRHAEHREVTVEVVDDVNSEWRCGPPEARGQRKLDAQHRQTRIAERQAEVPQEAEAAAMTRQQC